MYLITNYVKLRAFHYRLLLGALVTNKHLKIYKLKDSDLCHFCSQEVEDIGHLFWGCPVVAELWKNVQAWLDRIQEISCLPRLELNASSVILNNITVSPRHVSNVIVLATKHYIYRQKCLEEPINVYQLKEILLAHHKNEYLGALKDNKRTAFCVEKWQYALMVLSS